MMAARTTVNLQIHRERIVADAGHETCPWLMENFRASCDIARMENARAHVAARLGELPKFAAQHYLMSREQRFEHLVTGGNAFTLDGVLKAEPMPACGANCNSAGVGVGQRALARNERTRCHHSGCSGLTS